VAQERGLSTTPASQKSSSRLGDLTRPFVNWRNIAISLVDSLLRPIEKHISFAFVREKLKARTSIAYRAYGLAYAGLSGSGRS